MGPQKYKKSDWEKPQPDKYFLLHQYPRPLSELVLIHDVV